MLEYAFMAAMGLMVVIGAFCASRLDKTVNWTVRMACLAPALSALYTLTAIFLDNYGAYWPDVLRALAMLAVYWLAARPPMRCDMRGRERHVLDQKPKESP